MPRALLARLAAFAVLVPAAAAQAPDPTPVVYLPGGAQVEVCRRQWQTSAAVQARSAPLRFSNAIRTVDGLRRVDANDYTEAVRAVLQTGQVRARRAIILRGDGLGGSGAVRIELAAGESLDVLARGAEGTALFAWRGAVVQGELPGYSVQTADPSGELEVVREPVVETWVRLVEHEADRPAAWLNTSQAGVTERESFCG